MSGARRLPVPPRVVLAVARHPRLWGTALRQARALAPAGGLLPAADYLAFRLVTQYGDAGHVAEPDDVLSYLRWCRQWRAVARAR